MFVFIIGTTLLAIPFIFIGLFTDKKRGFLYILSFSLFFHTLLAFFLQIFGIFHYWTVFVGTLIAEIFVFIFLLKKGLFKRYSFNVSEISWIVFFVVIISAVYLFYVHYNYTGKIGVINNGVLGKAYIENMSYPYPYFSDEWYAVSLIKGTIETKSLPFYNILNGGFFLNLQFFTHSLLSQIVVLLGLDPLIHYSFLIIIFNTLIILVGFIFLRLCGLSETVSAISSLSILYITCASNLPGIWHLIPISFGIFFFLLGLCFMEIKDLKMIFISFFFVSLFYTLLAPFFITAIITFLFINYKEKILIILKYWKYYILALIVGMIGLILMVFIFPILQRVISYIISRLFFISFTKDFIQDNNLLNIFPIYILPLATIGIYLLFKNKKWIFFTMIICFAYWFLYSFIIYRIIIDFERVVYFTAILITLSAGFGLEYLFNLIIKKFKNEGEKVIKFAGILMLIFFVFAIPNYTQSRKWDKLVLTNYKTNAKMYAQPPANRYLISDDLKIFENIKEKRFLSLPWKGTVIGIATKNYPVVVKEGNIVIGDIKDPGIFISSNCEKKTEMAKKMKLDYVYMPPFNCPGFEKISESSEGLILYKFYDKNY